MKLSSLTLLCAWLIGGVGVGGCGAVGTVREDEQLFGDDAKADSTQSSGESIEAVTARLVGTWTGDGSAEYPLLTFRSDGTFTALGYCPMKVLGNELDRYPQDRCDYVARQGTYEVKAHEPKIHWRQPSGRVYLNLTAGRPIHYDFPLEITASQARLGLLGPYHLSTFTRAPAVWCGNTNECERLNLQSASPTSCVVQAPTSSSPVSPPRFLKDVALGTCVESSSAQP